ncbi:hypothetical protein PC129_g19966 [Phytophthora cactorum]|uniref:Uncharacterized protein n=1 Tax=Phytophthora cactorum TaxID=29920 RepID=A0A8T1H9K3_9STRA|nr:hypothetical protein Pcac1_g24508 [Phytophthora cactorum]KAG2804768.1 hypothetical protein PC112_g18568 [Phytophthora cactorum]KAG2805948.1 hypothetical protein PC111_g17590 [Phytophthora cactorum]KAG2934027.1 hypothetical protein PC114_g1124 [Phytophthora cactorum]KAG2943772.1 hypothetical protein PC115_g695 [Phytophthora cactorum]
MSDVSNVGFVLLSIFGVRKVLPMHQKLSLPATYVLLWETLNDVEITFINVR